ncbi:PP2C family protein-serine/threonine phosphatase [Cellulomonas fengjieae]|uniref:Serine/threonine-protein phosphatase n=1 Tax=Cellulomonas fengjieae TaxID=2819978 RepID=A0ABS3SIA5_9CELL|nr:PP2C family protein-serine/threonine phosphatase [Cellulomonas fengjieae]MBO3085477.1 serine/threonine-protein phosphatase [Cellulomonas fengjieae]QVI64476.1 serine/threonine-protein phosphatase [Cellulomonas fengjieae]
MSMRAATADEQRHALDIAYRRAHLSLDDLWLAYFTLGGEAGPMEVEAYLHGLMPLPRGQRDMLAHAVNERLDDLTTRLRVPYTRTLRDPTPITGPLAALAGLLDGTLQAAPEELVRLLPLAADALGVRAVLHVIDYAQRQLVPVHLDPAGRGRIVGGEPLGVDSTLAGQAFQRGHAISSPADDRHRMWVPVIDGVERLGVLEITPGDDEDLDDPQLRRDCLWVANLVGHLISAGGAYGDAFDAVRRTKPRSASGELIWNLIPPLTAGTDRFVIAGQFEPCDDVGGDAFDYALSQETARLAIFDATGHSLASGLAAAAALAASRNSRRSGAGLVEQASAIDDVIATHFADRMMYVSGILAEIDLTTGRLRFIVAGHPAPLLLRDGKIVKSLAGDGRGMFGLQMRAMSVGEETLEPGDRLLLYTDGITEARDRDGQFFGSDRLENFLQRADAAGYPPPETVRRLTRAVMEHQHGRLQDDATVLLASWLPTPSEHPAPGTPRRALT